MNRSTVVALILAAATAATSAQSPKTGLDALDPQRVETELANRGLETLLKRDFQLNHVPADQQNGIITLIALKQLSDPSSHLNAAQRRELITKISTGIATALPSMSDPKLLMQQATTLIKAGVEPDVNALEYFGDNPRTQAQLKPVVETVQKILARASDAAGKSAEKLANQMTSPNQTELADQWQQMTDLQTSAQYTANMEAYDLGLSLPENDPQRKTIADAAIEYLKQFDTKDSAVQATVRNRIAKLNLIKGDDTAAKQIFDTVATNPGGEIVPPPTPAQQYEAIYFGVVAQIDAGRISEAESSMTTLDAWQKRSLNATEQKGAAAAFTMLRYRVLSAQADKATDDTEKKSKNDEAMALLIGLIKDRPDLRSVIFDQVLGRLPANPDIASLDPLLLLALQQQGEQEYLKPESQKIDMSIMDRAIAATREIISRRGKGNVDFKTAAGSAHVLPYLLQREGKTKEAAAAFIDFAQQFPTELNDGNDALDHATALIGQLRKDDPQDQDTRALYDRFLPVAIGSPYFRKQFAFEYGLLLEREQKYVDAVRYLKLVGLNDPRALSAHFYEMFALKQQLSDPRQKNSPSDRQQTATQIQTLADQVNAAATKSLASATTGDEKQRYNSMLVSTALIAADLSLHEQKNPARTMQLLEGFEQKVAGLPNEQNQLGEALYLRVNSYMDLGKTGDATATLVKLLETKPGGEGPALVFDLLKKLDTEMDIAKAQNDTAQVQQLAQNRASLSGFLVAWAESNADSKIKALTPRYKAFDASTQQLAAELTDDPAAKKAGLEAALKRYQDLYKPDDADGTVSLGLGLVNYDLGHYADAIRYLSPLVVNKKIGDATQTIQANGTAQTVENTQYWEAILRLLQSTAAVAKQNPGDADAQNNLAQACTYLKRLYVEWPKTIGGVKYHDDYEKLRQQIIPDYHPDAGEPSA